MASHTVPAAIPDPPNEPPATGIPNLPGGPRTSLFAAVDPARPDDDSHGDSGAFHLNPTNGQADDTLLTDPDTSPSSDAFHNTQNNPDAPTSSGNSGKEETRIWRAWLLAGAERWRKGADARNKTLDIKKAKAQALQIKRAETVNRSEKIMGGNTATGSNNNSGKSSSTKTSNSGSGGASKGQGGTGRSGSGAAGRGSSGAHHKDTKGSGSGGKGWKDKATHGSTGSGKGGGKGAHVEHKTARETPPERSPRTSKTDKGSTTPPKSSKNDTPGTTTKTDKTTTSGSSGSGGRAGGGKADGTTKTPKAQQDTTTCGGASGLDLTKDKKNKTKTADSGTPGKTPAGTKTADAAKNPDTKGGTKNNPQQSATAAPAQPDPKKTKTDPKTDPKTAPAVRTVIDTKASREAGYRDGTRAGKVIAHAGAYKDGVKDGYRDTHDAAAKDKQRLDKAHADRKTPQTPAAPAPPVPPKPTIPPKPTSPPPKPDPRTLLMKPKETPVATQTATPAAPIQVKNADATHLELAGGADRQFISRGEVRNLAGHQHNLAGRKDNLTKIAERAKTYQAHAQQQTKNITQLLEQAKSSKVKGGEKVIAELAKLEEASKLQEAKASEVVKRAERSADACTAVSANLEVRYGDIYRAAADSADGPAELNYYRDRGYANV
jgi:hypothetical protein